MEVIQTEMLTKVYASGWPGMPPVKGLDQLTLSVRKGEIFGFLGPNGSGKTTTIKILMGLMAPTSGQAALLGHPVGDVPVRGRIGFLPESPYFYDYLTAEEFLSFYGGLAGLSGTDLNVRVNNMLEMVGLTEARTRQLRKFSKGMLQRIGLAQALIHDPELVILDEPMSGLDPIGRKQVRDLILSLRDRGKTIFFSTHIIPDVEMICDRVGIVMKGRLVACGRVDDLVSSSLTRIVEVVCEGVEPQEVPSITSMANKVIKRGRQLLIVLPGSEHVEEVIACILREGGKIISVVPQKGSLEELFFSPESAPRHASFAETRG